MSRLSECCQHFLEENGTSVYQLSKSSGLDRASLHRLVTGQRVPTLDFLLKFCDAMRMNHADLRELMELYEETSAGSAVYRNRRMIREIFGALNDMEQDTLQSDEPARGLQGGYIPLPHCTQTALQTSRTVLQFFFNTFNTPEADSEVLTNLPLGHMQLLPLIFQTSRLCQKTIRLRHLIYLSSNPNQAEEKNRNLEVLKYILPIALSGFDSYEPSYTYLRSDKNDLNMLLWPYYLVCGDTSIVVNASLTRAVISQNAGLTEVYRTEMLALFRHAKPLLTVSRSLDEAIRFYDVFLKQNHTLTGVIKFQPCVSPFLPLRCYAETLQKLQVSSEMKQQLLEFLRQANSNQSPSLMYFTRSGLDTYLKTGRIYGQYGAYAAPLTQNDRRHFLKQYTNACAQSSGLHMLRDDFPIPANLNVELYHHHSVLFILMGKDLQIRFAEVTESSLHEAFCDFFESLEAPWHSYSAGETRAELIRGATTLDI